MYQKARIQVTPVPKSLNAILKRSGDYKSQLEVQFGLDDPICKLLHEFMVFSTDYIGLLNKVPETISRNSFVVKNGIEKLSQEWNMLSRASEQRLIAGLKEELDRASSLAKTYCDKWNNIPQKQSAPALGMPVVYFEKMFRISRSIYAPQIPLISIPLTDYDQPENWQSLAHEFSHHIFWNGLGDQEIGRAHQELRTSVTKLFPSNPGKTTRQQTVRAELWANWLEEIFADVYGTLLAGYPYAVSAQERMAEQVNRKEDFLEADEEHVCVYLRPLISLYTLDYIAKIWNADQAPVKAQIDSLMQRWLTFSTPGSKLKYKNIPLATLADDIRNIVEIILSGKYWPKPFEPAAYLAGPIGAGTELPTLDPVEEQSILIQGIADLATITLPSRFEQIKQQLIGAAAETAKTLVMQQDIPDANALAWLSLTGLELSDFKNYHVHGCTGDHSHFPYYWFNKHYHPQDGTSVLSC